jgi:hypothetical protein
LSVPCDRSVVSPGTPVSSTNKTAPWYNWNIVESGVKHHKPTNYNILSKYCKLRWASGLFTSEAMSLLFCWREWVSDCCLAPNEQFFIYIVSGNKNLLSMKWWWWQLNWILNVLTHWNNSMLVDMSLQSDILSWFRPNLINIFETIVIFKYKLLSNWKYLYYVKFLCLPNTVYLRSNNLGWIQTIWIMGILMLLSTIFPLDCGDKSYWRRKAE